MKKILFAFVAITACLSTLDITAQHSGFYLYTGDAFVSTGMMLDKRIDDNTNTYLTGTYTEKTNGNGYSLYSSNERYITLGAGYRFEGGFGIELGVMSDVLYSGFLDQDYHNDKYDQYDYNEGKTNNLAVAGSLYHSSAVTDNLNLILSLSYRNLIIGSKAYRDFLIEPLCLEYMTPSRHWGFRFSLFSLETISRNEEEKSDNSISPPSFRETAGKMSTGLVLNSCPIKVCYYF